MANPDRPCGAKPFGKVKQTVVMQAGSTVYPGDFVKLANDGQVDAAAAAGDIFGVALSYATSGNDILVSCDPSQLYVVQADSTEIDAQTDVGNVADILATAGDTLYKTSRHELDSSTIDTSSAQLLILGIQARPDNVLGANVDVVVKINEHQAIGENDFAGI